MVTPDRRRRAVVVLQERFGVSERRACRVVGQHRSTQRRCPRPEPAEDEKLRRRLRQFAREHPRLGWRKAHAVVSREGWLINHKKLRRLWREEGLVRPAPSKRKIRRPGSGVDLARAEYPNHVWAIDFQFDETADQRRLKLANIIDEHTREALDIHVDRSITADDLVERLDRLAGQRGAPRYVRMDNGPRTRRLGAPGLVSAQRDRHRRYRSGLAVGEPMDRVVQRSAPRRMPQHQPVRVGHRSPG